MDSKSTPLNLLPNSQQLSNPQQPQPSHPSNQYLSDHNRQLAAVQNFTMPVNTQLGGEYSRDEDATIQETLMHLNGSDGGHVPAINQLAPLGSMQQPVPVPGQQQQAPSAQPLSPSPQVHSHTQYAQPQSDPHADVTRGAPIPSPGHYPYHPAPAQQTAWLSMLGDSDDCKLALLVTLITIGLTIVPFDRLVREYLPSGIADFPYIEIACKACAAGVLFYVLRAIIV